MGYTTAAWLSFGGALAAVAGALTGLLFVALSVKLVRWPRHAAAAPAPLRPRCC